MSGARQFMQQARRRYICANSAALHWQLGRMKPCSALIDTKINSITLQEYQAKDNLRSKQYIYSWIQGRGLEAMVVHARFFRTFEPELGCQLDKKVAPLYNWLKVLAKSPSGIAFCVNSQLQAVCCSDSSGRLLQRRDQGIACYSDLFVVKGMLAAAVHYFPDDTASHIARLKSIIAAIDQQRFILDESADITAQAVAVQADDYAPKMIALGAASLLHRLSLAHIDSFSTRYINETLACHFDARSGLLRTERNGLNCNIGHCIEFAGFALELCQHRDNAMRDTQWPIEQKLPDVQGLCRLLLAAFKHGFNGTGLVLNFDLESQRPASDLCPWWSLPETIRAAALGYACVIESDPQLAAQLLQVWRSAHNAFFTHYWRGSPPLAYQTLGPAGPLDYVPATPDLDPAYHTGLSLLGAIETIDRRVAELSAD